MKLPKTIELADKTFTIICDKNTGNSSFDFELGIIKIGAKWQKEILSNFLHEVLECLLAANAYRYTNCQGNYIFSFTHAEFSNICLQLSSILKDIVKD